MGTLKASLSYYHEVADKYEAKLRVVLGLEAERVTLLEKIQVGVCVSVRVGCCCCYCCTLVLLLPYSHTCGAACG